MKNQIVLLALILALPTFVMGQGPRDRGGRATDVPEHPQAVGEAGIAWYTTWQTGLQEAKRTNRPIFFMSAATVCSGVPGVF